MATTQSKIHTILSRMAGAARTIRVKLEIIGFLVKQYVQRQYDKTMAKRNKQKTPSLPPENRPVKTTKIRVLKSMWGVYNIPGEPGHIREVSSALAEDIIENGYGEKV